MGSGKSTWMINYIKTHPNERYMIVVPYLSEIERYKKEITTPALYEPIFKKGKSKYSHFEKLVKERRSIVTTHQLFLRMEQSILEDILAANYTLIIDESLAVFADMPYAINDLSVFKKCGILSTDEKTGKMFWDTSKEPDQEYDYGSLLPLKEACLNECVYDIHRTAFNKKKTNNLLWCLPEFVFKAFNDVFILTYLWEGSFHKMYFDFIGIKYSLYTLYDGKPTDYGNQAGNMQLKEQARKLITIIEDNGINMIGKPLTKRNNPLSSSWYKFHKNDNCMKSLKDNVANFFKNKTKKPAQQNLWTTFKEYQGKIKGNGYAGGNKNICFLPINTKGTNAFAHKTELAYTVNIYMNPEIKKFFENHGIEVNEELYATAEMIQWIWRGAIRNGQPITVYIPSERMRNLFKKWLITSDDILQAQKS